MRGIGALTLGSGLVAATIAYWPDLQDAWHQISGRKPAIEIPHATARWVNERQFDITAPAYFWNDECSVVSAAWWIQTRADGASPVPTESLSGPFVSRGKRPPRYQVSITPGIGGQLHIRATVPEWLTMDDVQLVAGYNMIPDDEPCASGWSGVIQLFRLQIMPLADRAGARPR